MSAYSVAALAERFALELRGDGTRTIAGVGTLASASPEHVSFLANPQYRAQLGASRAGAVVLRAEDAEHCASASLIAQDPYVAFAKIAALFDPDPRGHARRASELRRCSQRTCGCERQRRTALA